MACHQNGQARNFVPYQNTAAVPPGCQWTRDPLIWIESHRRDLLLCLWLAKMSSDDEKRAGDEVQQLTDAEIKRIEGLFKAKEKELTMV